MKTLAAVIIFDEEKVDFLRRDDEAYIPLPKIIRTVTFPVCYGTEAEVDAAKKVIFKIAQKDGENTLDRNSPKAIGPHGTSVITFPCTVGAVMDRLH